MEIFLIEVKIDETGFAEASNSLKEYYDGATHLQQTAINETFVLLCGHSYETLLEM